MSSGGPYCIWNPAGLCRCGCGRPVAIAGGSDFRRGWCIGRPLAFARGHAARAQVVRPDYIVDERTGCWVWQKYLDRDGYGRGPNRKAAHRMYYERYRGPIPGGLVIDHLCRNRSCVNPDHLEVVTLAENIRRGAQTRLDWSLIRVIRRAATRGVRQRTIARRFSIGEPHVSEIVHGNCWSSP